MKLLTSLSSLLLLPLSVLAQDPNNCNTEDKERDGADFTLLQKPDNANVASLSAIFAASDDLVTVAEIFESGNHKMTEHSSGGLSFESTSEFDDVNTEKWYPQGISSTADALDEGTYDGKDGFVVAWHDENDDSARITFIDRETNLYRHVLLVYPHAEDDFRAVPVHAGGMVWYGNTLWVVDTKNGIRVFDLDNIWRVADGDKVGKTGDTYSAQNYRYVVPQIMWYEWTPSFNFQHSYISLDRTSTPDSILVGEYQTADAGLPVRHVKYELDYETRRLVTDGDGIAEATWAYCVNVDRMQGAVQVDETIYMTQSNQNNPGNLYQWTPGGAAEVAGEWPKGPEDLVYDKRSGEIFTVTEHPGLRVIIGQKI